MSNTTSVDPYRAYNFKLEINNQVVGHFLKCSGISVRVHSILYSEAGNHIRHLPGPVDNQPVTLQLGLTEDRKLFDWFKAGVDGKVDRRTVVIKILDTDGVTEKLRFTLFDSWVSAWQSTRLDSAGREAGVESITLEYDSFERS